MGKAIFLKEWIKLKGFVFGILIFWIFILAYFTYTLSYTFSTTEPESMLWYRFVHLNERFYNPILYLLLLNAIALSLAQFLVERVRDRVRILLHLPINFQKILMLHQIAGIAFLFILWIFIFICTSSIMSYFYPTILLGDILKDFSLYFLLMIIFYFAISSLIIERNKIFLWGKFLSSLAFIFLIIRPDFEREFVRYYIFYSPILKEFIYQENHGGHNFSFTSQSKKSFTQKEYESMLPFVYWRDLEIQGKLPINIEGRIFEKDELKKERLSFEFIPKERRKSHAKLYPLFNPHSTQGAILFPEQAIYFGDSKISVYDFDNGLLKNETQMVNSLAREASLSFPIERVFGKSTNMKPFDLGYILIDSKKHAFNIRKQDDKMTLEEISFLNNIDISYIYISENRAQKFAGYLIDKASNFYLLRWDFNPILLPLEDFNAKTMSLQLIVDALGYLVRFNDTKRYFGIYFNKEFQEIGRIELK